MKRRILVMTVMALVLILTAVPAVGAAPLRQVACAQTHTVTAGDTLSILADRFLGNLQGYWAIMAQTNYKNAEDPSYARIVNPDLIEVGWKLCIPSKADADAFFAKFDPKNPESALLFAKPTVKIKVAVVSDIGGRGDLSFNDMAFAGADQARKELGIEVVELISKTEQDYIPNLTTAAKDPDVKLIVGVGFLLSDALAEVSQKYPDKDFMGIDTFAQSIVQGKTNAIAPNLMDIVFEEHKGSALVGALGAMLAAEYKKPHIGAVLGIEIPVLWKFECGYKTGAKWATDWMAQNKPDKAIPYTKDLVLWTYTGTFSDITKGYQAAKAMYEKDAVTVYNIAGPLGLGINQAVTEIAQAQNLQMGPPFWTGVDANQDWINPGFVIASMMKRVDKGVYQAIKWEAEGRFRDVVQGTKGVATLGVGTKILGLPSEGISMSTLADLDDFIAFGVEAEKAQGKKVLPGTPEEIKAKVKAMRDAQPAWIWQAVSELEAKIRSGEIVIPAASDEASIKKCRDELG